MITVLEELGYDMITMSTQVIVKSVTNKADYTEREQLTAREMAHGNEKLWAETTFTCIKRLCEAMQRDGVLVENVNFPELATDKLSRYLEIPYPLTLTVEEFIEGYERMGGVG